MQTTRSAYCTGGAASAERGASLAFDTFREGVTCLSIAGLPRAVTNVEGLDAAFYDALFTLDISSTSLRALPSGIEACNELFNIAADGSALAGIGGLRGFSSLGFVSLAGTEVCLRDCLVLCNTQIIGLDLSDTRAWAEIEALAHHRVLEAAKSRATFVTGGDAEEVQLDVLDVIACAVSLFPFVWAFNGVYVPAAARAELLQRDGARKTKLTKKFPEPRAPAVRDMEYSALLRSTVATFDRRAFERLHPHESFSKARPSRVADAVRLETLWGHWLRAQKLCATQHEATPSAWPVIGHSADWLRVPELLERVSALEHGIGRLLVFLAPLASAVANVWPAPFVHAALLSGIADDSKRLRPPSTNSTRQIPAAGLSPHGFKGTLEALSEAPAHVLAGLVSSTIRSLPSLQEIAAECGPEMADLASFLRSVGTHTDVPQQPELLADELESGNLYTLCSPRQLFMLILFSIMCMRSKTKLPQQRSHTNLKVGVLVRTLVAERADEAARDLHDDGLVTSTQAVECPPHQWPLIALRAVRRLAPSETALSQSLFGTLSLAASGRDKVLFQPVEASTAAPVLGATIRCADGTARTVDGGLPEPEEMEFKGICACPVEVDGVSMVIMRPAPRVGAQRLSHRIVQPKSVARWASSTGSVYQPPPSPVMERVPRPQSAPAPVQEPPKTLESDSFFVTRTEEETRERSAPGSRSTSAWRLHRTQK